MMKKTFIPFNLNDYIKVKMNQQGLAIYRKRYDDLWNGKKPLFEYQPPKTDENGWSEWQAWEFMHIFGQHLGNGFNNPCETSVYIQNNETDETKELCYRCHKNPGQPVHGCPYQCEINDHCEDYCNCCPNCQSDCADDI